MSHILCDYLPNLPSPQVAPPNTDCEVTPFLKLMRWDEKMKEYREDPQKRVTIRFLKAPLRDDDKGFLRLRQATQQYISKGMDLRAFGGNSLIVRKHLVQGRTLSNIPM